MRSTQLRWIFLLGLGSMPVVSGCAAKNVSGSSEVNYKRSSLSDLVSESDKDLATATIYDFFALKEGSVNLDWIMNLEYALKKETFEFLYLPKMTHLRVDIAAKIATFEGRYLSLNGVQSFDTGALEELGNFEGSDLSLGALNTIDVPTADALANCSAYVLSLNGLGELDASSAMSLATFQGGGLALNGLRNLSPDAIGKLSAFRGDSLSLNGLESLDTVAATALAAFKGGEISLNGVASIDTETATALAAFQGDSLSLNGLRDIDEEAARALANYGGYIATSNNAMERIAKEFLQKNQEKQAGFTAPENVSAPPSDAKKSDSGLLAQILEDGRGTQKPAAVDKVTIHYTGWKRDGTFIHSTYKSGQPESVSLSSLMPGWAEGILRMRVGEKTRFWIPQELAHNGAADKPEGMLVYDTVLVDINRILEAPADVSAPPAEAQKTESGLHYVVLQPSNGVDKPKATDRVMIHYTGWTTDGEMFDSTVANGRSITLSLGRVIPGLTEGLQLLSIGEKVRFWIPQELAYQGHQGAPQGMLVFDVELLDILSEP